MRSASKLSDLQLFEDTHLEMQNKFERHTAKRQCKKYPDTLNKYVLVVNSL